MDRLQALARLYSLLEILGNKAGRFKLRDCNGRMQWPVRGVYFFFDPCEARSDSGSGHRLIRIGTHALKENSKTSLWTRLTQHKGQEASGGGNHRGSIFRLLVGNALLNERGLTAGSWGQGNTAARAIRDSEHELERQVSHYIGELLFVCLAVADQAHPSSLRGHVERNAIALASNYGKPQLDPVSTEWLGQHSSRERVRNSGLWNQNHVDEACDLGFLDTMERLIIAM